MEHQAGDRPARARRHSHLSQRTARPFHRPAGSHQVISNPLSPKHMKQLIPLVLVFSLALGLPLNAQDIDSVAAGVSADLQKALTDLNAARKEVEEERLPIARKLSELEQKLMDRKAEYAKAERFQGNQLVELGVLKKQAKERSDEVKLVEALL